MHSTSRSITLLLTVGLFLACGGYSGTFKGNGTGTHVPASQVKVAASKDDVPGSYKELGIASGRAPTAQEAVDMAKHHCGGTGGGNLLIMNTEPFQSGASWKVDAVCASIGGGGSKAAKTSEGRAPQ